MNMPEYTKIGIIALTFSYASPFGFILGLWDDQTLIPGHPCSARHNLHFVVWALCWISHWLVTPVSSAPSSPQHIWQAGHIGGEICSWVHVQSPCWEPCLVTEDRPIFLCVPHY